MPAQPLLHRRLCTFVEWIRPTVDTERQIREQADMIRRTIRDEAHKNDLRIASTPSSGSFEKRTGLRRHLQHGVMLEGQDVDLPFVVNPSSQVHAELGALLNRFERYAALRFPANPRRTTRSSVNLGFPGTHLTYDLVPMLSTEHPGEQILIRANGERIRTSVERHVEFVRKRTNESNTKPGPVRFNECLRLFKWWRNVRALRGQGPEIPTFTLELLCAHAFDSRGVRDSWHETMRDWVGFLHGVVKNHQRITFTDYGGRPPVQAAVAWEILDPVSPVNNVVARWSAHEVQTLAAWLGEARDAWVRAIETDAKGRDLESMTALVALFGEPFRQGSGG